MIHVCNHGHVPDVGLFVHDGTDLVYSEVHLDTEVGQQLGIKCGQ